jgi:hypothetical protein
VEIDLFVVPARLELADINLAPNLNLSLGNIETFEMDKYYKLFPDLVEKIHYFFLFLCEFK